MQKIYQVDWVPTAKIASFLHHKTSFYFDVPNSDILQSFGFAIPVVEMGFVSQYLSLHILFADCMTNRTNKPLCEARRAGSRMHPED